MVLLTVGSHCFELGGPGGPAKSLQLLLGTGRTLWTCQKSSLTGRYWEDPVGPLRVTSHCSELGGSGGPAQGLWAVLRPERTRWTCPGSAVSAQNWGDPMDLPRVCSHCSELGGPGPAKSLLSVRNCVVLDDV